MNNVNEFEPIDANIARKMVEAYGVDASNANAQAYTKAVWFPAAQILEMAEKIKEGDHDGLRIYFAKYVADGLTDIPESHKGRNTVLLVPTFVAGKTNHLGATTAAHEDDLSDIENRGTLCPSMCDGVEL